MAAEAQRETRLGAEVDEEGDGGDGTQYIRQRARIAYAYFITKVVPISSDYATHKTHVISFLSRKALSFVPHSFDED